jgi:hypothetical protein
LHYLLVILHMYFLNLEDGTDELSRNVGKVLTLDAAKYPRRAQISRRVFVIQVPRHTVAKFTWTEKVKLG